MTSVLELINSFDQRSKEYEDFLGKLISLNGDTPFDTNEVDRVQATIISAVNTRLNQAHSRCSGLSILEKILPQCSKEVLLKYCMLWLGKCTLVLENVHSSTLDLTLACKVLGSLLIQLKDISEIHKQVSMQNVKQIIHAITALETHNLCTAIYYLIAVLLYHYPEVSERFQGPIRKMILSQLGSTHDGFVNASAKCYALLARATARSFKPPASKPLYTGWLYNQAVICNSLHNIMDELFANLVEMQKVDVWDKLDLPSVSEGNVIDFYSTYRQRFVNLCCYLSAMLCGYDKKNSVSVQDILQVLCRGLTITPLNLQNKETFKEQMLYLMLPKLHVSLLNVLEALINGCKEQLIPHGSTILQLFQQILQWTENVMQDQTTISGSRPFKNVRISVYKCLISWLVNLNSMSGIETIMDDLLPLILKDIIPEKDRVLLTIQKTQNMSKRALKRLRDSQYEKSAHLATGLHKKKELSLDIDVCKEALIALQNIFFSGGAWLKQKVFKTVQNVIIPLLYDCYLSSAEDKFYKVNGECRLQLLRLLRSLQINPHLLIPSPTEYSLELFEMALSDSNLYVIHEAKIALVEIEKIIHPAAPSLQIAQVEEIQKEFISENRDKEDTELFEGMRESNENSEEEDMTPSSNKRPRNSDSITNEEKTTRSSSPVEVTSNQNTPIDKTAASREERDTTTMDEDSTAESLSADTSFIGMTSSQASEMVQSIDSAEFSAERNLKEQDKKGTDETDDLINEDNGKHDEVEQHMDATTESEKTTKSSPSDDSIDEETLLQLFHDETKENV